MADFELEVNVSGEIYPEYAIDIIERVSLGDINALYMKDGRAASYKIDRSEAQRYLKDIFSDEADLLEEDEQKKSGLYYLERDGFTKVTKLPTPLKYNGKEMVRLENLALTKSEQFCYTLRLDFQEDEEEFVTLRNVYSYDSPQVRKEDKFNQFFELVGSLEMLLKE